MAVLKEFIKQPADKEKYYIDFSEWLAARGDTGSSMTFVINAGITKHSDALLDWNSVTKSLAEIVVSLGDPGESYKATATLTTTGGRIKEAEILITNIET